MADEPRRTLAEEIAALPANSEPSRRTTDTVKFSGSLPTLPGVAVVKERGPNSAEVLAVSFARILRGAGLIVPVDTVFACQVALDAVGLHDRELVYWATRATLLRRPEDIELFDRAFKVFWERRKVVIDMLPNTQTETLSIGIDDDSDDGDADPDSAEAAEEPDIMLRFSATEVLRSKDFAQYSPEELEDAYRMMTTLRLVGAPRRSRRLIASRKHQGRPDLRRTVRAALRAGGEPVQWRYRTQGERQRRLILLLDISGSMEPYARALLRFVHAAVVGRQKVEVFTLGTRLTRVTRELSSRDPDRALASAAHSVQDWSGGTRLGDGLRAFNDAWGVRGMARGATVVIMSDGWDRGLPEVLAEQMARLHRVAYQTVWVNPLKFTPGYAPLARGMAAALPYVDDFIEGHSVDAMAELARVISLHSR